MKHFIKILSLAVSLGGYESLIEHPYKIKLTWFDKKNKIIIFLQRATMTHAMIPADQRRELGINDNFVRISVGLESADDLIDDINQALLKAVNVWDIKFNYYDFLW